MPDVKVGDWLKKNWSKMANFDLAISQLKEEYTIKRKNKYKHI